MSCIFSPTILKIPNRDPYSGGLSTIGSKCSLDKEKIRWLTMRYIIPSDIEIAIPHKYDRVRYPPVGLSVLYINYLKVGLRLPLFHHLMNILEHYHIALTQLESNAIRIVVVSQFYYNKKKVESSVVLFKIFFRLKSAGVSELYAFFSRCPSLKVKTTNKNANWKDKFFFYCLPASIDGPTKWNLWDIQDKIGL